MNESGNENRPHNKTPAPPVGIGSGLGEVAPDEEESKAIEQEKLQIEREKEAIRKQQK